MSLSWLSEKPLSWTFAKMLRDGAPSEHAGAPRGSAGLTGFEPMSPSKFSHSTMPSTGQVPSPFLPLRAPGPPHAAFTSDLLTFSILRSGSWGSS